ncbi:MAG TPA: PH domain-containing protein [Candidatus Nanoarchaeia archaeon]|nr:PH domain-containing protein [Candidatus Nanoarchaeia archaeon]
MPVSYEDEVLAKYCRTRKAYLVEYSCGFLLLGLLGYSKLNGDYIAPGVTLLIGGTGLFSLLLAEYSRLITRYKITRSKITIVHGFIKRQKKNVYFHPLGFVPDLNVKQGRLQRILGYGSVFLRGTQGNVFEIRNVNNPSKVLDLIEDLIKKNKNE